MDVLVRQLWSSAVVIFGVLSIIAGFTVDWNPFLEKWVPAKLRNHHKFKWIVFCLFSMAVSLHCIWTLPTTLPVAAIPTPSAPESSPPSMPNLAPSEPTSNKTPERHADAKEEKDEPVVNQQSAQMATEFEYLMGKVTGVTLTEHERRWYSEYLEATMPAKIEAICGTEECRIYEKLLHRMKSKSDDIQLHYRGMAPFVTKKRFLNPDTPLAGPVIVFDQITAPDVLPLEVAKKLEEFADSTPPKVIQPEAPKPVDHLGNIVAKVPNDESGHNTEIQTANSNVRDFQKPKMVTHSDAVTPLDKFLNEGATVTCRRCGQVHQMNKGYFATYDHHICARCRSTMSTVAFSAKMAKQRDSIIVEMNEK